MCCARIVLVPLPHSPPLRTPRRLLAGQRLLDAVATPAAARAPPPHRSVAARQLRASCAPAARQEGERLLTGRHCAIGGR
eukprot:7385332-Prymnesium_polylepis.3